MREFIRDKNTYILIILVLGFTVWNGMIWGQISVIQKYVVVFAIFAALHEIEEKVWPGGFCELMMRTMGANTQDPNVRMATLPVTIYWIVILSLIYVLHEYAFLLSILIVLSFFEAFVHTMGIKVHRMEKPYTPGLVTAWGMAAVGFAAVCYLNAHGLVDAAGYALGGGLMVMGFAVMGYFVYKPTGVNPMVMMKRVLQERKRAD